MGARGCSVYVTQPHLSSWVWKYLLCQISHHSTHTSSAMLERLNQLKKPTGPQNLPGALNPMGSHCMPFLIVLSLWRGPRDLLSIALPWLQCLMSLGLVVQLVLGSFPEQHILTDVLSSSCTPKFSHSFQSQLRTPVPSVLRCVQFLL